MTRGRPMTGNCKGCGHSKLEARQLCTRCYDYARTNARRQGLDLAEYMAITTDLKSPGKHGGSQPAKHNTSGYRGCYPDHGKWRACIRHRGKAFHLGRFDDLEQARIAYANAQLRIQAGLPPRNQAGKTKRQLGGIDQWSSQGSTAGEDLARTEAGCAVFRHSSTATRPAVPDQ